MESTSLLIVAQASFCIPNLDRKFKPFTLGKNISK